MTLPRTALHDPHDRRQGRASGRQPGAPRQGPMVPGRGPSGGPRQDPMVPGRAAGTTHVPTTRPGHAVAQGEQPPSVRPGFPVGGAPPSVRPGHPVGGAPHRPDGQSSVLGGHAGATHGGAQPYITPSKKPGRGTLHISRRDARGRLKWTRARVTYKTEGHGAARIVTVHVAKKLPVKIAKRWRAWQGRSVALRGGHGGRAGHGHAGHGHAGHGVAGSPKKWWSSHMQCMYYCQTKDGGSKKICRDICKNNSRRIGALKQKPPLPHEQEAEVDRAVRASRGRRPGRGSPRTSPRRPTTRISAKKGLACVQSCMKGKPFSQLSACWAACDYSPAKKTPARKGRAAGYRGGMAGAHHRDSINQEIARRKRQKRGRAGANVNDSCFSCQGGRG